MLDYRNVKDRDSQEEPVKSGLEGGVGVVNATIDETLERLCSIELMELSAKMGQEDDTLIERCRKQQWFYIVETLLSGPEESVNKVRERVAVVIRKRASGVLDLYQ